MKTTTSGLLALVVIICTGVPAYAQGQKWESLMTTSTALYKQGRYGDALVLAKEALDVAEKVAGPNQTFLAAKSEHPRGAVPGPRPVRAGRAALQARAGDPRRERSWAQIIRMWRRT